MLLALVLTACSGPPAVPAAEPELDVDASACAFACVSPGEIERCTVVIRNLGGAVDIDDIHTASASFVITRELAFPIQVGAGESLDVELAVVPISEGVADDAIVVVARGVQFDAALSIDASAPIVATASIASVNGVDIAPGSSPEIRELDEIDLRIEASFDEACDSINSVEWRVSQAPAGVSLSSPNAPVTTVITSRAGRYELVGVVIAASGLISEATIAFEVLPQPVELIAQLDGENAQLHVARGPDPAWCVDELPVVDNTVRVELVDGSTFIAADRGTSLRVFLNGRLDGAYQLDGLDRFLIVGRIDVDGTNAVFTTIEETIPHPCP